MQETGLADQELRVPEDDLQQVVWTEAVARMEDYLRVRLALVAAHRSILRNLLAVDQAGQDPVVQGLVVETEGQEMEMEYLLLAEG